jgi:hypothetical protein
MFSSAEYENPPLWDVLPGYQEQTRDRFFKALNDPETSTSEKREYEEAVRTLNALDCSEAQTLTSRQPRTRPSVPV